MAVLRQLEEKDEQVFREYVESWKEESIVPSILKLEKYRDFRHLVQSINNADENTKTVSSTTLLLFDADTIVGAVNMRHRLNDKLRERGGHIGYGVGPNYRRKGYAKYLLKSALHFLESRGIEVALITCDMDNIGSQKVIEAFDVIEKEKAEVLGTKIFRYHVFTHVERQE